MALVELRDIERVFPATPPVTALSGLSLDIDDGEFVSIVGTSGSGKSTLLNVITLLDRATAGDYRLCGRSVGELNERELAALRSSLFGLVFQSFHLLGHYSATENVELGIVYRGMGRAHRRRVARDALERVGLGHRTDHRAGQLSGGERQRVAIARALASGARVIVADEPTGNLDSANSQSIVALLRRLNHDGVTVVMVTHDADVAASADRVIELRDGEVAGRAGSSAHGPPAADELSSAPRPSRMRVSDLVRESARALSANKRRAAALVGAVTVAVGLVVATLGLSQTATAQVSDRFDAVRNREVTVNVGDSGPEESSLRRTGVPSDVEDRVGRLAGVVNAGVLAEADASVSLAVDEAPRDTRLVGGVACPHGSDQSRCEVG